MADGLAHASDLIIRLVANGFEPVEAEDVIRTPQLGFASAGSPTTRINDTPVPLPDRVRPGPSAPRGQRGDAQELAVEVVVLGHKWPCFTEAG
jgi:hypothetical protein